MTAWSPAGKYGCPIVCTIASSIGAVAMTTRRIANAAASQRPRRPDLRDGSGDGGPDAPLAGGPDEGRDAMREDDRDGGRGEVRSGEREGVGEVIVGRCRRC